MIDWQFVAIIGSTVIWYNDLEEGFNRSRYSTMGTIDDYWCNQDGLERTLQYLMSAIDHGRDILRVVSSKAPGPRR